MLFSKIWPPNIIEETEITDWKQFSYEYGIDNGLNENESKSFADMISYFIGNGPAIPLENKYFKIQKIQFDILAALPDIKELENEKDQVKTLFDFIFIMYNEKIYQYTKKSEKISFRLTKKQYDDFMSVPGKDKADKLETLLEAYYHIDESIDNIREFLLKESSKLSKERMNIMSRSLDPLVTFQVPKDSQFITPSFMEEQEKKLRKRLNCSDGDARKETDEVYCIYCKHLMVGIRGFDKLGLCSKKHKPTTTNIGIKCEDYEKKGTVHELCKSNDNTLALTKSMELIKEPLCENCIHKDESLEWHKEHNVEISIDGVNIHGDNLANITDHHCNLYEEKCCDNCYWQSYDWFDDGDEFEVCRKGNQIGTIHCKDYLDFDEGDE